jgi:hypothetical protein
MHAAAEAAREALARGDEEEARRQTLRLVGAATVMREYDWSPEKLANTRPEDRQAIEAVMPVVRQLLDAAPQPPEELVFAWASVDEAMRFARSKQPTDIDRQETRKRVDAAQDALAAADESLAPHRVPRDLWPHVDYALRYAREGRHALAATDEPTADVLAAAEPSLHEAAMALTPLPEPEDAERLAAITHQAKETFQRAVMARGVANQAIATPAAKEGDGGAALPAAH